MGYKHTRRDDVPLPLDPSRRMFPPLRRICVVGRADATAPTLLDIRIFNPQTRFDYML